MSKTNSISEIPFAKDMRGIADNSGTRMLEKNLGRIADAIRSAAENGDYYIQIYSWIGVWHKIDNPDVIVDILIDHGYKAEKIVYSLDGSWKIIVSWEDDKQKKPCIIRSGDHEKSL